MTTDASRTTSTTTASTTEPQPSSAADRGATSRRLYVLLTLAALLALSLVAVLGGALLSLRLTRSPMAPAPAQQTTQVGETPNQREDRVPATGTSNAGETPNQREDRVPGPGRATNTSAERRS